jgi:hypothetical protein
VQFCRDRSSQTRLEQPNLFQAKSLKTGSVTQMAEARPAERMIVSLKNQSFASSPLEAK